LNQFSDDDSNILPSDQTWRNVYTALELGIPTDYQVTLQMKRSGTDSYLKLSAAQVGSGTPEGEAAGSVYVDVTALGLDQNASYYISYLTGSGRENELLWKGNNVVSSPYDSRFVNVNGRTYLRIAGAAPSQENAGRTVELYLDDIAISRADLNPDSFGAYQYESGTSMSAPMVSGALATLASANPGMGVKSLRKLLLKSVRKVSGLSDLCVTGGILDLSKLATGTTGVTLNKTSATLRYGRTLNLKATVTPVYASNTKVTWTSSNTKYAVVTSKGVVKMKKAGIGHTVSITAKAADGSGKKAVCKIRLKR
jgi:uncharacterized protein YjdB